MARINTNMKTIPNDNMAQAYLEGMLETAFGVRIFSDNVAEWQIDSRSVLQRMLKSRFRE